MHRWRVPEHSSVHERETKMDLKLEVVVLPVSDVDRAKAFYEK
ncbi:VOC family protein, partial [Streptomyces parvulus]